MKHTNAVFHINTGYHFGSCEPEQALTRDLGHILPAHKSKCDVKRERDIYIYI